MKKIALIVGHTARHQGAMNTAKGMGEYGFNNRLAKKISTLLSEAGLDPIIVYRKSYTGLPAKVNLTKADIAISLHCNAFNKKVSGCEVLHFIGSKTGFLLASCMQKAILGVLGNNDRGLKGIAYEYKGSKGDRGGWLVQKTKMPCVITEPFFIDNNEELDNALTKIDLLAKAYVDGIKRYISF